MWLEPIREDVQNHPHLIHLVQLYQEGEAVGPWVYKDGILFFMNRIYLREDSPLTDTIIKEIPSSTHEGYHKSLHQIRSIF